MKEYKNRGKWSDIQVHLTNHCDHKCQHCYTGSKADENDWIPESTFQSVVNFATETSHRILRLLGGEVVTSDFRLLPYLRMARIRLDRIVLCTNGYYLDPWVCGLIDPCDFMEIIVSCYGFKEAHESMTRVKGSYNRTYNTIEWLATQKERTYELTVNTLVTGYNCEHFVDFVRTLAERGVDEVKVLCLSPLGNAAPNNAVFDDNLVVAPEIRKTLRNKIISVFESHAGKKTKIIWEQTNIGNGYTGIPSCKLEQNTMVTIDRYGFVYPCHLLIGQPRFAIGRVTEDADSLRTVLNEYEQRDSLSYKKNSNKIMKQGCPAYWSTIKSASQVLNNGRTLCPLYLQQLAE